ncbi:MAG: hypothetical protein AB1451_11340 [Nitrospirota bacterium]
MSFVWGRAWLGYDHPRKVATDPADTSTHLGPQIGKVIALTRRELLIISPYFVPGKETRTFVNAVIGNAAALFQ